MPTAVMEGRGPRDVPPAAVPEVVVEPPSIAPAVTHLPMTSQQAQLRTGLGSRADIEAELDGIAFAMRCFTLKQPDQIMREVAAYSARLTELTVLLHRVEASDRQYTRVRTQQVEKFLVELDRQFKIASRLVEVMRQDLELMR
jgi:hypothetical protein